MAQTNRAEFKNLLHISYSQIWTYLECSLKYQFQYVEKRAPERVSIALFFGSSIHTCLERYYNTFRLTGVPEQLSILTELFAEKMTLDMTNQKIPVIYKKETPDFETAIELGFSLLETFYNSIDMVGMDIIGVELPLTSLISDDINLVGSIDLLLKDVTQNLIIVDTKTASKAKSQTDVDNDLQFSGYSHLLVENGYASKSDMILCRLDVLRKLKTPKLEYYYTTRNLWHRKRFVWIAQAVLAGIENRVFIPTRSWLCVDCQFANTCAGWR
jgi:putative RecB family exonuclease